MLLDEEEEPISFACTDNWRSVGAKKTKNTWTGKTTLAEKVLYQEDLAPTDQATKARGLSQPKEPTAAERA